MACFVIFRTDITKPDDEILCHFLRSLNEKRRLIQILQIEIRLTCINLRCYVLAKNADYLPAAAAAPLAARVNLTAHTTASLALNISRPS